MKQKTRIIIYIAIALTALALGIIAVLSAPKSDTSKTADEFLNAGNKYLIELSYDKAVIEFNKAIEIEPRNADAYIGLAEAYLGMGDEEKAVETLELGYENTGDERIKAKLDELIGEPEETTEITVTTTEATTTVSETFIDEMVDVYVPYDFEVYTKSDSYPQNSLSASPLSLNDKIAFAIRKYNGDKYTRELSCSYYKKHSNYDVLHNRTPIIYMSSSNEFYFNIIDDENPLLANATPAITCYDENGNISRRAENEYDLMNNKLIHTSLYDNNDTLISETFFEYDTDGKLIKSLINNGTSTEYVYDSYDNLIKVICFSADGEETSTTEYVYDNNCITVKSPYNEYIYKYDSNNNLIEYIFSTADGSSYSTFYDENGNIVEKSDCHYQYHYKYDSNSNLISVEKIFSDSHYYYKYDSNSNLISEERYNGDNNYIVIYYTYDSDGKIIRSESTTEFYYDGTYSSETISYSYDSYGRLSSSFINSQRTLSYGEFETESSEERYYYNDSGMLIEHICDGTRETYAYDEANRIINYSRYSDDLLWISYDIKYRKIALPRIYIEGIKDRYGIDLAA